MHPLTWSERSRITSWLLIWWCYSPSHVLVIFVVSCDNNFPLLWFPLVLNVFCNWKDNLSFKNCGFLQNQYQPVVLEARTASISLKTPAPFLFLHDTWNQLQLFLFLLFCVIFLAHTEKDGIWCWFVSPNDSFWRVCPDLQPQSGSSNKMNTIQTRVLWHIDEVFGRDKWQLRRMRDSEKSLLVPLELAWHVVS